MKWRLKLFTSLALLSAALLSACSRVPTAPEKPHPLRLDESGNLVVRQPDVPEQLLFEIGPYRLDAGWVAR